MPIACDESVSTSILPSCTSAGFWGTTTLFPCTCAPPFCWHAGSAATFLQQASTSLKCLSYNFHMLSVLVWTLRSVSKQSQGLWQVNNILSDTAYAQPVSVSQTQLVSGGSCSSWFWPGNSNRSGVLWQVDQYLLDTPYIDSETPHFIDIGGNDILALLLMVRLAQRKCMYRGSHMCMWSFVLFTCFQRDLVFVHQVSAEPLIHAYVMVDTVLRPLQCRCSMAVRQSMTCQPSHRTSQWYTPCGPPAVVQHCSTAACSNCHAHSHMHSSI